MKYFKPGGKISKKETNIIGGIGAMISTFTRQSRTPEIYALLFIIVIIGLLQDKLFQVMKPILFPSTKK